MPGNSKKRKRHVQRAATPMAGLSVLMRAQSVREPVTDHEAGELEIVALTAIDAVTRGHGTTHEWDAVARCLNQAWILSTHGIGEEAIPVLLEAQNAMKRVAARFRETGRVVFDGDGLTSIREGIAIWGRQLRISSIGEVDAAIRVVEKHYKSAPI